MPDLKFLLACSGALALSSCSAGDDTGADAARSPGDTAGEVAGARSPGDARLVTVEGRIGEGAECATLTTPDGAIWSFTMGEADFAPGDYVSLTGEVADASYCQQGRGTLVVERIDEIEPPARDRDPARAGGIELTEDYVAGSWVAKGKRAGCDAPDFRIVASAAAVVLRGEIGGRDDSARVVLDQYPRLDLDEPMPDLPMEARGPDGLAILRPATDAACDPITIGPATVAGDGVVLVRWSG